MYGLAFYLTPQNVPSVLLSYVYLNKESVFFCRNCVSVIAFRENIYWLVRFT